MNNGQPEEERTLDFTCNICGKHNTGVERFDREVQNCSGCLSNVRIRGLVYALSIELFGTPLQLRDFPVMKGLRALGMTDEDSYASRLNDKFDYKNTFFDREPKLDITDIDPANEGAFDLVISSEVFEHVRPPFENALANVFRLLRPNGILILTVPYHLDDQPSREHFPHLADAGLAHLRSGPVLVNRTNDGTLQVFDQLAFHLGNDNSENSSKTAGSTLEMRILNEAALRCSLLKVGFKYVEFYGVDYLPFGIRNMIPCSLPLAARRQPFELTAALRTELMQQYGQLSEKFRILHGEYNRQHTQHKKEIQDLAHRVRWALKWDGRMKRIRRELTTLRTRLLGRGAR